MSTARFGVIFGLSLAAAAGLDRWLGSPGDLSLLLALLFWSALGQGAIALVAAVELAQGKWLGALRPLLLELAPCLLASPILFLLLETHLAAYPWSAQPTLWLAPVFFLARNTLLLALTAGLALGFARACRREESPWRGRLAVLYLFSFVITQSLAGFDWVMSLDAPWISTLFGPLFFVEAFFGATALAVILSAVLCWRGVAAARPIVKDSATLLFGFSLLWGGLFFAHVLTLWYANIPEEVAFLTSRLEIPGMLELGIFMVLAFFAVPFTAAIPSKSRSVPGIALVLAVSVLLGYQAEKAFYVLPRAEVCAGLWFVQWILLGIPFLARLIPWIRNAAI